MRSAYRFAAEVLAPGGGDEVLDTLVLDGIDWEPALQCAYFNAVRRGQAPPWMHCPAGDVEPLWQAAGAPYVRALRVRADGASDRGLLVPRGYLRAAVQGAAAPLVSDGRLEAGTPFRYRLLAFRVVGAAYDAGPAPDADRLELPLPLADARLADVLRGAVACRDGVWSDADPPVLLPAAVLDEVRALAAAADDVETGGVLIGRLCRDRVAGEVLVQVTAVLPARHGIAAAASFTFTPDTWAAAQAALALRGANESIVGWFHTHPWFCRACPAERQRTCSRSRPFLSEEDRALHRTVFGRAFDLALLVADRGPAGRECALYGWRRGLLVRRGYHIGPNPRGVVRHGEQGARDAREAYAGPRR